MEVLNLARAGNVKALVDRISGRVDVDSRLELEEWNSLQLACAEGDDATAKTLLAVAADPDYQLDTHVMPQHSSLMIACRYGYINVIQSLLNAGASHSLQDNYGYTALHYAAANGHYKAVDLLLKAGANVSQISKDGSSALDFALEKRHLKIADTLRQWQGKYSDENLTLFKSWLEAIECGQFFDRFIRAGYDFAFVAQYGLDDADLDCVGVPMSMLGLRKKLKALHRIDEFKASQDDDEEEEEEDEEEDDGEEEEDDE